MIIYGRNVIREALAAGVPLREALLQKTASPSPELDDLARRLETAGTAVEKVSPERLEAVTHSRDHQGVAARLKSFPYAEADRVLETTRGDLFLIVLDRVQDPHNLGAIVRTAAAAGADLVVLAEHGGCRITPAALKASAGCAFRVPVAIETNLPRFLDLLKKRGCWVYGAVTDGESCFGLDYAGGAALVFGNEGEGLRRLVLEKCDFRVRVPMAREVDSLNVSVSAAVIAFQVFSSRRKNENK